MDMTDAKYADNNLQTEKYKVTLTVLNEKKKDTIFNVIILEQNKDKDSANGKQWNNYRLEI